MVISVLRIRIPILCFHGDNSALVRNCAYNSKFFQDFQVGGFTTPSLHILGKFCDDSQFLHMEAQPMRLWSIHPKYLDPKGLVALWMESLLAQKVLIGETRGYKNHPQLERFTKHPDPISVIGSYLYHVYEEGKRRGYHFQKEKILIAIKQMHIIEVSRGQIFFEFEHLKEKLKTRDPEIYKQLLTIKEIEAHPVFKIVEGKIEQWEKTY